MGGEFRDNVVVVTGASSGIGAALCMRFALDGARIVLAARNAAALHEVASDCASLGAETHVVRTDVERDDDCRRMVEETVARFGRIDTLVNNAGIGMHARFADLADPSVIARVMDVNFQGSVRCTWHALPHLLGSRGRIVAVSSLSGKAGVPLRTGYAASKHAMAGFFDSLRIELAPDGVSVTVAYPGFVSTPIGSRALGPDGAPLSDRMTMRKNVMTPGRCADLIVNAAAARKREIVMTAMGKIGQWVRLVAPGAIDRFAERAVAGRYHVAP